MAYIPKESVAKAREMDLLTYLQLYAPHELIRMGPNSYKMRSHDSLKLSNGKWMWWSRHVGGVSALDYLILVEGIPFLSAVEKMLNLKGIPILESNPEVKQKTFQLPAACRNNEQAMAYLAGRGIDQEIIEMCIRKELIYEAEPYHNVIFVGYDWNSGKAAYAAYRSIRKNRIMGEVGGSRKDFAFRIVGDEEGVSVHVFESAIDALSYLTIVKQEGGDWNEINCLSLGGVHAGKNIPSLTNFLMKYQPEIIVLHLDNDTAGHTAVKTIQEKLTPKYIVRAEYPACGKDVNDELLQLLRRKIRNDRGTR